MWPEILTLEAFWFWTLVVVQSALVIYFVSQDQVIPAVLSALSVIAGMAFFPSQWESIGLGELQRLGFWMFVRTHFGAILAAAGSYLLLGLGWATFRWWLYVIDIRTAYECRKTEWLAPANLLNSASFFRAQAVIIESDEAKQRYQRWAEACSEAAARGGRILTTELKPVWKDFVENGYRF